MRRQRAELAPDRPDVALDSPDRFRYEWDLYSEMRPEYEEQFRRWTIHLDQDDWRGLRFMDVGCGMGRNSYWPMKYGASGGVAIDVDERSLAAARRTLASHPSVEVRLQLHALPITWPTSCAVSPCRMRSRTRR